MSWWPVIALCAGAYGLKAIGLAAGGRLDPAVAERRRLALLVVPILGALIAVQTLSAGHRLVLDARAPALLVAGVLVWRRAPFLVVAVAAAATAALLRLVM
jgi:branched-subunit amino acid transport protein